MSRPKTRVVVACDKHGRASDAQFRWSGKAVAVNPPSGKRDRQTGGCPQCKAEQRDAAKEAV